MKEEGLRRGVEREERGAVMRKERERGDTEGKGLWEEGVKVILTGRGTE